VRIYVVGAGAIGLLYASRLSRSGIPVTLVTRTAEQAAAVNERGVLLEEKGVWSEIAVQAAAFDDLSGGGAAPAGEGDWIWLTVKQPHLREPLLGALRRLAGERARVIAMQNGIGHLDLLRGELPDVSLYAAISTEGALREHETAVRHTGEGSLTFGLWPEGAPEHDPAQKMLLQLLEAAGISSFLSNEMHNRVYHKLLVNAVINPLTAIYGVSNGKLPEDGVRLALMKALHAESLRILQAAGMQDDGDSWERLIDVCRQTAANESSMLRDVKAGRTTEVDWINGGISSLARKYGMPSPLNDAVTAIVKALTT
jgi:2-dehydropantoate 2-reductase